MWRELQPDVQAAPLVELLRKSSFVFAARSLPLLRDSSLVLVRQSCFQSIMDHLRSQNTELGGLMLGAAYVPRELGSTLKGCITVIEQVVQSDRCRTTVVSLAMNTEVWDKARQMLSQTMQVVGLMACRQQTRKRRKSLVLRGRRRLRCHRQCKTKMSKISALARGVRENAHRFDKRQSSFIA